MSPFSIDIDVFDYTPPPPNVNRFSKTRLLLQSIFITPVCRKTEKSNRTCAIALWNHSATGSVAGKLK